MSMGMRAAGGISGDSLRPLCPELYVLLRRAFGDVAISNPGDEMIAKRGLDPLTRRPCVNVSWWGETYRVNCPFCDDNRQRLWINHTYGQLDASDHAKRQTFFGVCYNEDCLKKSGNRERLADLIFGFKNKHNRVPPQILPGRREVPVLGPKPPPGEVISICDLPPHHKALQYMVGERRYSLQTLYHYGVGYCINASSDYRLAYDRVIIPIWFRGQYVGWQARYIGEPPHKAVPKYYTCPGMAKRLLFYNFDNAKDRPFVVIVEGVTDVWAVGDNAVAVLGKTLTLEQRALLQTYWEGKPVVLLLDPDAQVQMDGIVDLLLATGRSPVIRVNLPMGYDAGNYDQTTLNNVIYAQAAQSGILLPR